MRHAEASEGCGSKLELRLEMLWRVGRARRHIMRVLAWLYRGFITVGLIYSGQPHDLCEVAGSEQSHLRSRS